MRAFAGSSAYTLYDISIKRKYHESVISIVICSL